MKTICAIATARMNAAIHIIRISGPDAFEIINTILDKPVSKIGFKIWHRNIISDNEILDNVLVNTFVCPKSYTGEDLIEINCHGGVYLADKIINLLCLKGCTLAKNGEFSQRALLNKKIDVFQVESINNLIYAENDLALKGSINALQGNLKKIIEPIKDEIFQVLGQLFVNIDYPEFDDVPYMSCSEAILILNNAHKKLINLIKASKQYLPLSSGIKIAIIGSPNAGKSSLLNFLSNENKAIVSDILGTTRDIIESVIKIDDLILKLYDTAGIRKTSDPLEQLGIAKSYEIINKVDIILYLVDSNVNNIDYKIIDQIKDKNYLIVYTKSDLRSIQNLNENEISISVKNEDVKQLIDKLKIIFHSDDFINCSNLCVLQSVRQINEFLNVESNLIKAINIMKETNLSDLATEPLEICVSTLSKLLGETNDYDFLDDLFKHFCIGK